MKSVGKLVGWTLALACANALAADQAPMSARASSAPQGQVSPSVDNTNINQRDKDGATKTPQTQSNDAQDRELLVAVRRAVVKDNALSTMAHNIKIVAQGGVVTLRGPVKDADEKAKIEAHAKDVHGVTRIDNQLDVKTSGAPQ